MCIRDSSNINRQAIAFHSTIGKRKVDVMEAMIHDINPDVYKRQILITTAGEGWGARPEPILSSHTT